MLNRNVIGAVATVLMSANREGHSASGSKKRAAAPSETSVSPGPNSDLMKFKDETTGEMIEIAAPRDLRDEAVSILHDGIPQYAETLKLKAELKTLTDGENSTEKRLLRLAQDCARRCNGNSTTTRQTFSACCRFAEDGWKAEQEAKGIEKPSLQTVNRPWVQFKSSIIQSQTTKVEAATGRVIYKAVDLLAVQPAVKNQDGTEDGQAILAYGTPGKLRSKLQERRAVTAEEKVGKVLVGLATETPALKAVLVKLGKVLNIMDTEGQNAAADALNEAWLAISAMTEGGQRHAAHQTATDAGADTRKAAQMRSGSR